MDSFSSSTLSVDLLCRHAALLVRILLPSPSSLSRYSCRSRLFHLLCSVLYFLFVFNPCALQVLGCGIDEGEGERGLMFVDDLSFLCGLFLFYYDNTLVLLLTCVMRINSWIDYNHKGHKSQFFPFLFIFLYFLLSSSLSLTTHPYSNLNSYLFLKTCDIFLFSFLFPYSRLFSLSHFLLQKNQFLTRNTVSKSGFPEIRLFHFFPSLFMIPAILLFLTFLPLITVHAKIKDKEKYILSYYSEIRFYKSISSFLLENLYERWALILKQKYPILQLFIILRVIRNSWRLWTYAHVTPGPIMWNRRRNKLRLNV